jgi:DNA-binding CsgD family transcriptional regulator
MTNPRFSSFKRTMIVAVLDNKLTHTCVSSVVPPLTEKDVIGKPAWHFLDTDEERELVKSRLAMCLILQEPQVYQVRTTIGDVPLVWSVRACPIPCGVLLMSVVVPAGFDLLTKRELEVLQHSRLGLSQVQIARLLKVSKGTVSRVEDGIRRKMGGVTRAGLFGFEMPGW